ncbi:MAG: YXWGXW repeat-containing protein [Reyranellales bacterium]
MFTRSLFTLVVATALSTAVVAPAVFSPASAQIDFNINFGPPPAPQYELVPAPRPGYAWAPGYWQVENNRHVWAPGHWMQQRPGQHWVADRWDSHREGDRDRWQHQAGHWDNDGPAQTSNKRPDNGRR